jgi:type VI secretion system protein ImpK
MTAPDHRDDETGRTVVRPNPGGRLGRGTDPAGPQPGWLANSPQQGAMSGATGQSDASFADVAGLRSGSTNPLLSHATPLLALISQIRAVSAVADAAALKESLTVAVRRFEADAQTTGVPREQVLGARYLLCTFIDEAAASTPWGSGGSWASDPLLVRFHNETWGGEKAFQLLAKLAQQPTTQRDLLELFYVCLSLGFEGRYRVIEGGRSQLESVRERLYEMVRAHTPAHDGALSARMQPVATMRPGWVDATPAWVFCAVALALALGLYASYATVLNRESDAVYASLQRLRLPATPEPAPAIQTAARPRLATLLQPEVREGLVSVRDEANRSIVLIQGDGLFQPGSAEVDAQVVPLLGRIASALREHGSLVMVTGHTDSVPIRSVRFPSNWQLSQERARSVSQILGRTLGPQRVEFEGRGDAEPLAPNDSPTGRAKNRRVEITLFAGR